MANITTQTSLKTRTFVRIGMILAVAIGVGLIGYFYVFTPSAPGAGDSLGKLEPEVPPGALTYSLDDIYNKTIYGQEANLEQKKVAPSKEPVDTMVTIDSIYKAIPPADKICQGTNTGKANCGIAPPSTPTPVQSQTPTPTSSSAPTPTPSPTPIASENLVLWLPFDETTGNKFIDSSDQRNDGVCLWDKCPRFGKTGKVNKAVEFDGTNDYVSLSKKFSFSEGITVEAWVNFKTGQNVSTIYSTGYQNRNSSGYHFFYVVQYPPVKPLLYWQWAINNDYKAFYSSAPLNLNEWYHLIATHDYDTKKVVFYINGAFAGESSSTNEQVIPVLNQDGFIGSYGGGTHFLNGLLDEVKVYNKALSTDEVSDEYNSYQR